MLNVINPNSHYDLIQIYNDELVNRKLSPEYLWPSYNMKHTVGSDAPSLGKD